MKKLFLGIGIVIVIVCSFSKINAQCRCKLVPGSREYEPPKALRTSDVVFTGELIQIQQGSALKFKIESVWKTDIGETFILTTFKRSCEFSGRVGEKYLIYAYKHNGAFTTNYCTRTRVLASAEEDLKAFDEKGEKPVKTYK